MEQVHADSGSSRTLTAFFDSRDDAQRALDRLDALGLPDGSAKLVRGNEASDANGDNEHRGFWETLSDFFFPDDDRAAYAEGLRRGGFLVTASGIPADRYDEALDILDDEGSVDVDARAGEWRSEGWSGAAYGDGRPFERGTAVSASDLSMAGTGVGASAFTGGRLAGGTGGYDEGRDITSARAGTDTWNTADKDARLDADEAAASSAAPVASDAARLDNAYDDAGRRVAQRDLETGRTRARSYSFSGIAEDAARRTDVQIEDERGLSRKEGTSGGQV